MRKFIYILVVAMIFLTGCVEEKKYINPKAQDYIVCSFGELPATLDIMDMDTNYYQGIYTYLFEGLVTMDRKGQITPALAEDWTVSDDGIGYTFDIREDARWSDGSRIYAEDFVTFFKYILAKSTKNPLASELYPIYGVEDYSKGKIKFDGVAIRALNKTQLEIRLNKATPDFLKILSQPSYVLRKDSSRLKGWKENYKDIQYSGPFKIQNINKNGVMLEKNQSYWDSDSITEERFLLASNMSKEQALAEFEEGKVDLMLNPPVSEMDRIISSDNTIIIKSQDVVTLSFNATKGKIVTDTALRKQVITSIDIEKLVINSLKEFNPEEYGIFKAIETFNSIEEDSDKNKDKKEKVSLVLITENNDINKRVSREIVKQVEKDSKITVTIKYLIPEEVKEEIAKGEYDLLLQKIKSSNVNVTTNEKEDSSLNLSLFNSADVVIKNDYIDGIEIDSCGYIMLNNIYQQ